MHFYHGKITSCIPLPSTGAQLCANFCPQTALSLPLIEYSTRMQLELKCGSLKNFVPGSSVFFVKKRVSLPVTQLAFSACAVCI